MDEYLSLYPSRHLALGLKVLLLSSLLLACACAPKDTALQITTPAASITPTPQPTLTAASTSPTPRPTLAVVTASPTPRPTLAATAIPLPQPTRQPPEPTRDGQQAPAGLIYRATDGFWRVEVGGEATQLSPFPDAQLSPDGARALYADERGVWVIDVTTGAEWNLLAGGDYFSWCCPRWAGDEMVLLGVWYQGDDPGPGSGYPTAAASDGSWIRALDDRSVSNALPAASPDGRFVAYDQGGSAWLYDWQDGPQRIDLAAYGLPTLKSINIGSPAWSSDARHLAWVVGGGLGDDWRIGLAVLDLDAGTSRLLHPYEPIGVGGWPAAPVWSPDGAWLAYFISHALDPAQGGLWVVRADGEEERSIGKFADPVWSPDGRWLVFAEHSDERQTAVWLLEIGVWEPQLLALPPVAVPAGWVGVWPF